MKSIGRIAVNELTPFWWKRKRKRRSGSGTKIHGLRIPDYKWTSVFVNIYLKKFFQRTLNLLSFSAEFFYDSGSGIEKCDCSLFLNTSIAVILIPHCGDCQLASGPNTTTTTTTAVAAAAGMAAGSGDRVGEFFLGKKRDR